MPSHSAAVQPRGISFYRKLFFLYALNLSDWLCTEALLATGRFFEANPVMSPVLPHFLPTLLLKGLMPLGLTLLCALLYRLARDENARLPHVLIDIGIVAYTLVNLWHIVNFVLLFSSK